MSEIEHEDKRPPYESPVQGVVSAASQAPTDGLYWQSWKKDTHDPRSGPLQINLGLFFDGTGNNENKIGINSSIPTLCGYETPTKSGHQKAISVPTSPASARPSPKLAKWRPARSFCLHPKEFEMKFDAVLRYVLAGLLGLVLGGCALPRTFTPVQIEGVQHLGPDYNISQFYIDGASGGNVGRGGGGGGGPCCANLPDKWYPGMKSVVRWSVNDWSHENRAQTSKGDYSSLKYGGTLKATVPVEKYDHTANIFVHFFPGGKVRVVVGVYDLQRIRPPAQQQDPNWKPIDEATQGVEVEALFTKEELEERDRQDREYKKKHGDWR